eukprot:ANDGO_01200.mRNA.1 hypothetical protein
MGAGAAKDRQDFFERRSEYIEQNRELFVRVAKRQELGEKEREQREAIQARSAATSKSASRSKTRDSSLFEVVRQLRQAEEESKGGQKRAERQFPRVSVRETLLWRGACEPSDEGQEEDDLAHRLGLDPRPRSRRPAWGVQKEIAEMVNVATIRVERDKKMLGSRDLVQGRGAAPEWNWILWDDDHHVPVNTKLRINPSAYVTEYVDPPVRVTRDRDEVQPVVIPGALRTRSVDYSASLHLPAARDGHDGGGNDCDHEHGIRDHDDNDDDDDDDHDHDDPQAILRRKARLKQQHHRRDGGEDVDGARITMPRAVIEMLPEPCAPPHKSLAELFCDTLKGPYPQWVSVTLHIMPVFELPAGVSMSDFEQGKSIIVPAVTSRVTHVFGAFQDVFGAVSPDDVVGKPITSIIRKPEVDPLLLKKPESELTSAELLRKRFFPDENYFPYSWIIAKRPKMSAPQSMRYNMLTEVEVLAKKLVVHKPDDSGEPAEPQYDVTGDIRYFAAMQILPPPKYAQYARKVPEKYTMKIFAKMDPFGTTVVRSEDAYSSDQ